MTRILFLHGASDRLAAAARWLGETAPNQEPVLVYAPNDNAADRLDRLLWTQGATGFVPHCRYSSPLCAETPIVITDQLDTLLHDNILLNLSDTVPQGFSRFAQVVEVVSTEGEDRGPARERFRFYRERGYAPLSNDLSVSL